MNYLKNFENFAQDMMSIPTSLNRGKTFQEPEKFNVQDMMSIPTSIKKGNSYDEDPNNNYISLLQPYYDQIKSFTMAKNGLGIKDISQITHEILDKYVGFSFVTHYTKVMIVSDKKQVFMLINQELIPLEGPGEIIKIIESEA
jgi:hypothetical protein